MKIRRLNCCKRGIPAFVSAFASRTFDCLIKRLGCQDAKRDRCSCLNDNTSDAGADSICNIFEMWRFSPDYAAKAYERIIPVKEGERLCDVGDFECTGTIDDVDRRLFRFMLVQALQGAIQKAARNELVKAAYDNPERIRCSPGLSFDDSGHWKIFQKERKRGFLTTDQSAAHGLDGCSGDVDLTEEVVIIFQSTMKI